MSWKRIFLFLLSTLPQISLAASLSETLMERSAIEKVFQPYMQYDSSAVTEQNQFLHVLPYANQLSLIRMQLRQIVDSYAFMKHDEYSLKMLQILDSSFPEKGDGIFIQFENSRDGRFQVDGTNADRLAINTGDGIIFNVQGLLEKKNLSLAEATQLWLHELSHFDKTTPLAVRDQWASNVAQWVRENTTEIQLQDGHKLMALILPQTRIDDEKIKTGPYPARDPLVLQAQRIQKRFFFLEQDSEGTRLYQKAYDAFTTFNTSIQNKAPLWDQIIFQNTDLAWPEIFVDSVKLLSNKTVQINYRQTVVSYQRLGSGTEFTSVTKTLQEENETIRPFYPTAAFRIEINPENQNTDIKRNYSTQINGQFELYRVEDKGSKRYISLHLKLQDIAKTLIDPTAIHLLGRSSEEKEMLSFNIKTFRILNRDEILLHFEVSNRNMELSQILIPQSNHVGRYWENQILPAQPFTLIGTSKSDRGSSSLSGVQITEKQSPDDSVRMHLNLQTTKKVAGVTLDLEHSLLAIESSGAQRGYSRNLAFLGEGRKYYLKAKDIVVKDGILSFTVPEAVISQHGEGPEITKQITWAYTKKFRIKAETLRDTQLRSVKALWVHFTDGTVSRLSNEQLPQGSFSLKFDPANVRILQCKDIF